MNSMQTISNDRESSTPIGTRIREARKSAGMTQKELAAKASLHYNALSAIESGSSKHPKRETLARIANALNLSVKQLEGSAPATPPGSDAVASFLEGFRLKSPESFIDWPTEWNDIMWRRFTEIGTKMGITTDYGAHFFADRVAKEFITVSQFLDLCDWNRAATVESLIAEEHARANTSRSPIGARVDSAHRLSEPHATNAYVG